MEMVHRTARRSVEYKLIDARRGVIPQFRSIVILPMYYYYYYYYLGLSVCARFHGGSIHKRGRGKPEFRIYVTHPGAGEKSSSPPEPNHGSAQQQETCVCVRMVFV